MTELLLDPATWILTVFVLIIAVVAGRMRHESRLSIVMTAVGVNAFLIGVRWAGIIGGEAPTAVWITSGGMALWGAAVRMAERRSVAAGS